MDWLSEIAKGDVLRITDLRGNQAVDTLFLGAMLRSTKRTAAGGTNAGAAWEAGGHMQLMAIIEREGDGYVALCPQLDVASQGETVAESRENLIEALTLFFEVAEEEEVQERLRGEVYVTQVEVSAAVG